MRTRARLGVRNTVSKERSDAVDGCPNVLSAEQGGSRLLSGQTPHLQLTICIARVPQVHWPEHREPTPQTIA